MNDASGALDEHRHFTEETDRPKVCWPTLQWQIEVHGPVLVRVPEQRHCQLYFVRVPGFAIAVENG